MNIYFFSHHPPHPEMIQDLGEQITTQFKEEITGIQRQGQLISFTETLFIGGQRITANHHICARNVECRGSTHIPGGVISCKGC